MEDFRKIFTGLKRAHGCTFVDKKGADGLKVKGKSFVKREIVTDQHWENHLNGIEPSLGIIPINEDNECRWGCIDVDKYTLNHREIINKINQFAIPLSVCRSKSGGAHIFLFTTDFVPAKLMRDKLMSISAVLGFGNAEVFPKQIELKSQDDTGNFLNLPYFNCKNTTRYCFDLQGRAVTIDVFLNAVEVSALTPKELQDLQIKRPPSEFDDGPPCLESLTKQKLEDGIVGKDDERWKDHKDELHKTRKSKVCFLNEYWINNIICPFVSDANRNGGWNFSLTEVESSQFTHYTSDNSFYGWHQDEHSIVYPNDHHNVNFRNKIRKLSCSVLLSEPNTYEGGDFDFAIPMAKHANLMYKKITLKSLEVGTMIVFPSFTLHRVNPVTKGTRYSLVVWALGPTYD